jgi:uncharacterized protein YdiU (UPF0061 family)
MGLTTRSTDHGALIHLMKGFTTMKTITIADFFAALADLFQSPEVAAANRARRNIRRNDAFIADAEALLQRVKAQKVTDARADADNLKDVLATAATNAAQAEERRLGQIDRINEATEKRIKSLEEAIAKARLANAEELGRLAEKQSASRAAETTRRDTAQSALDAVSGIAGDNTAE